MPLLATVITTITTQTTTAHHHLTPGTDMCDDNDMDCVARNGDGGRSGGRACEWYYTGAQSKSCSIAGDLDDVCVCQSRTP